jgi:hypothetical protein
MHSYWRREQQAAKHYCSEKRLHFSTIESRTNKVSILRYSAPSFILTLLLDLPVGEGLSSIIHQQNKKDVKMQRREFLKLTAAVSVASALPLWSRSVLPPAAHLCLYPNCLPPTRVIASR